MLLSIVLSCAGDTAFPAPQNGTAAGVEIQAGYLELADRYGRSSSRVVPQEGLESRLAIWNWLTGTAFLAPQSGATGDVGIQAGNWNWLTGTACLAPLIASTGSVGIQVGYWNWLTGTAFRVNLAEAG